MRDIFSNSERYDFTKTWNSSSYTMVVSSFCFSPCKFTSFEIMKSKTPEICIAFAINNCIVDNVSCSIPISATKRDEISLAFRSVAFSSPAIYIIWAHNNNERVFSFYFQHFCYEVHFFWREVIYQMIKQQMLMKKIIISFCS